MSRSIISTSALYTPDLFTTSTSPLSDLGAFATSDNGEEYRYVYAGAVDLVAGTLIQGPAEVANHTNIAVKVAAAVGDSTVTVTLGATAATENQYQGGLLLINDVDGQGFAYRIASNPAASGGTDLTLTLTDTIREALTTSSQATLQANQFNGAIICPTTLTGPVIGVAITDLPARNYGWIQTKGVVPLLNNGGTALGLGVSPSGTTAGAVDTATAGSFIVGQAVVAGVSTEYNPVRINID